MPSALIAALTARDAEERSINEGVESAQTPLTSMVANQRLDQIANERAAAR
jgi:hypothetical protein